MRQWVVGFVASVLCASACRAADLTPTEIRWLQGAWPVIAFAHEAKLPLDIVVQPQPTPGAAPLALGFVDGRCKLVLSMRGNAEAESALERIDPELLDATLEMMAAHELGHCQRYLEGAWYRSPAGFTISAPATLAAQSQQAYVNMQATRREEAYADLVGLAWIRRHHAQKYDQLYAWLVKERAEDLIPGGHHDTLAWLRLVGNGNALTLASIFSAAAALWTDGLAAD